MKFKHTETNKNHTETYQSNCSICLHMFTIPVSNRFIQSGQMSLLHKE